ncbi:hypothetical protein Q8F55_004817 [Vanrija albida]|uniref:Thioesterase domain-containing protein n=1 Tax=Vanrija albida TaxID=181172 RepID=A0ABR3Q064_9TREE
MSALLAPGPPPPGMRPFTEEEAAIAVRFVDAPPWGQELAGTIKPEYCDDVPPVNARGGRDAAGFRAVFSGVITEGMCNPLQNMHGGCSATIVDVMTSAAIAVVSTESFWGIPMLSGVSVNLDMVYYHPGQVGKKIKIVCEVERISPTLCNTRADIVEWDTGKRIAGGTHVKAWRPAKL